MRDDDESRHGQKERDRISKRRHFSLMSMREVHRVVVRACGRLVLGHGAEEALWTAHLDRATVTDVAIDLSCVNDVDARGLGVLANLVRRARQRDLIVSVIAASRVVQRLGEMTHLDRALPGAWHERIGVLNCRAGKAPLNRMHPPLRHSGHDVCDESSAAA